MSTILVRYCEIGLKSTPVRIRFEDILRNNMLTMLASDGIEALVSYADARYYIESEDIDGCVKSIKRVFGIGSLSVTEVCTSQMDDVCRTAAEYSVGRLSEGQSFAVKARREGTHPYKSMEIAKEAGSAIFLRNEHLGIKVDLTNPDHIFYIEIRNNKAYIFDEYIPCPGGLPLGSQGRVSADVEDDRGLVSAWMMMKRGCRVIVNGDYGNELLRRYDPYLKTKEDDKDILGKVKGTSLEDLPKVDVSAYDVPVYFPTIGMSDDDVQSLLNSMRTSEF